MSEVVLLSPEKLDAIVEAAVARGVKNALESQSRMNLMNEEKAAEYLGLSPLTLRQWRVAKKGPAYVKNGRAALYYKKDLDAWLEQSRVLTIDSLEARHGISG